MSNIEQYLPNIYKGITETDTITRVENGLFDELLQNLVIGKNNQFILTANERGITEYENIAGIISKPSDDLDFRRRRVLNRFSTNQLFTFNVLKSKLDSIIGVGAWNAYIDYDNYTLYVESSASDQAWYNELLITINNGKPANIVFVNIPLISAYIKANETVSYSQRLWNYKLGTTWSLGELPFASIHNIGEIKMSSTPSIKSELLNNLANYTVNDIAKVRVNGSYIVSTFTEKITNNNIATVQYVIPIDSGITQVDKIELLDSDDNVLTESKVYVPLLTDLIMKHTLSVLEG